VLVPTPVRLQVPPPARRRRARCKRPDDPRRDRLSRRLRLRRNITGRDIGGYVEEAKRAVREELALKPATSSSGPGQYEKHDPRSRAAQGRRADHLALIFILLVANTSRPSRQLSSCSPAVLGIGAIWLFHFLDYNVSIAAWAA